jgi:hypothetical protein
MSGRLRLACVAAMLSLAGCASRGSGDDPAALHAQIAQLKAQLAAAEQQLAALHAAPAATVAVAPPATATAETVPPPAPPGKEYVLVDKTEANSQTGCSKGLFQASADRPWKHEQNWREINRGMSPPEVEKYLGPDHYDVNAKGRTAWQYGKCDSNVQAFVVFESGHVLFWQPPDF